MVKVDRIGEVYFCLVCLEELVGLDELELEVGGGEFSRAELDEAGV